MRFRLISDGQAEFFRASAFFAALAALCLVPAAQGLASPAAKPDLPTEAPLAAEAHFPDSLIATGATTPRETAALSSALADYERRGRVDDFSRLVAFLKAHPHSSWRVALLTNLGDLYLHYGYFTRAIAAWDEAWREGRKLRGAYARALVDEAVGKLALLDAQLGHENRVARLLHEIALRPVSGPATTFVQNAREMLWVMRNDPKHLYLCGPEALATLMAAEGATAKELSFVWKLRASSKGMSLAALARLAAEEKEPLVAVFRRPGEPVPVPSIVHWKVGHYAAISGEKDGRYRVVDPVLGRQARWLTKAALDAEGSGYFLAPEQAAKAGGWRLVADAEGGKVWGAGPTGGPDPHDPGPPADPPPDDSVGMTQYDISELQVGVILTDNPVGYVPRIGPSAEIVLTYNQYEADQPALFGFFNVSPKWTFNFLTHIEDDPTDPGASVSRYRTFGGAWLYTGYDSATGAFVADDHDDSVLVLASESPVAYRRFLKDGTVEVYAQSDGATSFPRRVFLTKITDREGNSLTLNYGIVSGHVVLQSLTDAVGGKTTFTYGSSVSPLLVTKITDSSGSAVLGYDSSGRLVSITDTLGRTSSFKYDASSLINSLTNPLGTTTFLFGGSGNTRFVEAVDPLGDHEREETLQPALVVPFSDPANTVPKGIIAPFNQYLDYRDSFHWDKEQFVLAGCNPSGSGGCNYNLARDTHFAHDVVDGFVQSITGHFIESVKNPSGNRIWYDYAGQEIPGCGGLGTACDGTYDMPLGIGRVLGDGTTQLTQCGYNSVGNLTEIVYPTGQTFNFIYAANGIDLVLVQQVTGSGPVTVPARQSGIVLRLAQAACTVGAQQPLFAGTPRTPNCHGESVSTLAQQYGGLDAAAGALDYPSVGDLQNAIDTYCGA